MSLGDAMRRLIDRVRTRRVAARRAEAIDRALRLGQTLGAEVEAQPAPQTLP